MGADLQNVRFTTVLWIGSGLNLGEEFTAFVFPAPNRCLVDLVGHLLRPCMSPLGGLADSLIVLFIVLGANSSWFLCSTRTFSCFLPPPLTSKLSECFKDFCLSY